MFDKNKERKSTNARVKRFWSRNPDKRRANSIKYKQNPDVARARRRLRLLEVLSSKGTCCAMCGYNSNTAALEFHHLRDKKFTIAAKLSYYPIDVVKQEVEKCILLCSNCHRELHNPQCKILS